MTLQVASAIGTGQDVRTSEGQPGWLVVAEQECRDLWASGRGLILLFLFSVLVSAVAYLTSTNLALNFLEQRESVNLVLQFAVAVGVLATLVVSADGISGERERGTLGDAAGHARFSTIDHHRQTHRRTDVVVRHISHQHPLPVGARS